MKYVFGPVPSRRLGQSLGVDTIPLKTCNWNCVYCQLGRSVPLAHERREYVPRKAILEELKTALAAHSPGEIDWLTFVGSGEPTLHNGLGWLITEVKALTDLPIAVITNGSLLYLPEVRRELQPADAVLPSLDAGSPDLYRRLNRPHPEATFERLIDGLATFRREYTGQLWVEIMLVRDLNDSEEALSSMAAVLQMIRPDEVHINLPTRPPVETWVQPPDEEGLLRARSILGAIAHIVYPASGSFDLSGSDTLLDALIGIITRHPMQESEIVASLEHWSADEMNSCLTDLKSSGLAQLIERYGKRFWSAAPAHFPDTAQRSKTVREKGRSILE